MATDDNPDREGFPPLDPELVRAIAWCAGRTRYGYPDYSSSLKAQELGLLRHDPIWAATPQGDGVLIALGILPPSWNNERVSFIVLWARTDANPYAQFVAAWPTGLEEAWPDAFARAVKEAKAKWREWPGEGDEWYFATTYEEIGRPQWKFHEDDEDG